MEKLPRLNWATQFVKVAYDGAYSHNVSFKMASITFGSLPCRKKKALGSSHLDIVEIARITWRASFQPL